MNSFEEGFVQHCLTPWVEFNIPGRLRFRFAGYMLLPEDVKTHLHYAEDVLKLLPGVREVQMNPYIGSVLVLYTPGEIESAQILGWVGIVVDTCLELAREMEDEDDVDESALVARIRSRLVLRLPQTIEE